VDNTEIPAEGKLAELEGRSATGEVAVCVLRFPKWADRKSFGPFEKSSREKEPMKSHESLEHITSRIVERPDEATPLISFPKTLVTHSKIPCS
jgi:hypothetical protein